MIGWLLKMLDPAPDKEIGELIGPAFGRALHVLGWSALGSLVVLGASLATFYAGAHVPPAKFSLVDHDKKVYDAQAGVTPLLSTPKVERWVERALIDSHSFNFTNLDNKVETSRVWFDPLSYNQFSASLRERKVIERVKKFRLNVWLTPLAPAQVTNSFRYEDSIYWEVELPAVISYTGDNPQTATRVLFQVLVRQANTVDNPDGLTIVKMAAPPFN